MIACLVSGTLYDKPQARRSRNDNEFVTAKARAATRDGAMVFVNLIAFSASVVSALMVLSEGDAIAVTGELKVGAYIDKNGKPQGSLDLLVTGCLTLYEFKKKRAAVQKTSASEGERTSTDSATESESEPAQRDLDDAIPF